MPEQSREQLLTSASRACSGFFMDRLPVLNAEGQHVCTKCVRKTWYTLEEGLWQCHTGDLLFDVYHMACDEVLAHLKENHRRELLDVDSEHDASRLNKIYIKQLKRLAALDSNAKTKNVISMTSRMLYNEHFKRGVLFEIIYF